MLAIKELILSLEKVDQKLSFAGISECKLCRIAARAAQAGKNVLLHFACLTLWS